MDADAAVAQVRAWVAAAATSRGGSDAAADRLRALLRDPAGVRFAVRFVDQVLRPDDDRVAAQQLAAAVADLGAPTFLGAIDRLLLQVGARLAPQLPQVTMPLARRRLRQLIGHLLVDASPDVLSRRLASDDGGRAPLRRNINLLGEAVLGEGEADRRLAGTIALVQRPDVDHVSIKISAVAAQLDPYDHVGEVERLVRRLRPLYRAARDAHPTTFVNLDMEEHRDLELTLDVFERLTCDEEFHRLPAGVAIQAYLPDSVGAVDRLVDLARRRVAAGGAPLRVRLVKGANLAVERADAEWHGWPQAPYLTKAEVDANYERLIARLLRPEVTESLHVGVASHNLFAVASAWQRVVSHGLHRAVGFEMLEGMAPDLARVVREDVGGLLLYTPVVDPADLDVATSYLVRRLEEVAAVDNFLRTVFDLHADPVAFAREERRFRAAVDSGSPATLPRQRQDRTASYTPWPLDAPFGNEPDTDPTVPANRRFVAEHLAVAPGPAASPRVEHAEGVDRLVARALDAAGRWRTTPPEERRAVLRRVGDELAAARGPLLAAMAHEAGKPVGEADPEVSEAVDFARWYADRAVELDDDAHASFDPHQVVVVTPPWNFPVAIPIGGCLAALAAGAAVVLKPAPQTERCAELAVQAAWRAGVPEDALQVARVPEDAAGRRLVTHPDVDAVVLTGGYATARRFRRWRPELRLLAETSGKNALVITASADVDLAVADLVRSAFGHAGQKCSAASLAILVGDVDASGRVRRQLADATRSLRVGDATAAGSRVGPLIGPPSGDLERALTRLEPGERWLVTPEPLDDDRRLWRPGIRDGVQPGSWFHHTECFGPVLGLIDVPDLDTAIEVQNAVAYGLTGGLHSLDDREVGRWLAEVEVGNAYVNRSITGAIVRRQPFGGWKRSSVGPGAKAGGPHYVAQFGTWTDRPAPSEPPDGIVTGSAGRLLATLRPHLRAAQLERLHRAFAADEQAWADRYGREHDPSELACEANVLRYRPRGPLTVRVASDEAEVHVDALRVVGATLRAGTPVRISTARPLPGPLAGACADQHVPTIVEDAATAVAGCAAPAASDGRIRAVGPVETALREAAVAADVDVRDEPVTRSGHRELLAVLREQAVSRTMHRYGTPVSGPAIPAR